MRSEAARAGESSVGGEVLYMVLELSARSWKVLFRSRSGRQRECSVAAGDVTRLLAEMAAAKRRLGLPPEARVVSCYEAGRDGFWLDRALRANGIENLVVDSSSIEVPRRSRRKKTDRIDLIKLMGLLLRYVGGERTVWSVVRVPDAQVEDVRQLSRGIERLKTERRRHTMRIQSLLVKEGIRLALVGGRDWAKRVEALRLGPYLTCELIQEGERLALVERQLAGLKAERERMVASSPSRIADYTRRLRELGAVAQESSFVFSAELFGWRTFANRRELAGAVGITGTPFQSGEVDHEQGISKAGNRRMRTMLVEIAWCWLRFQRRSALSLWWQRRFGAGNKRTRRIGLVALARKLLVALWRYLEHGVVPEGATLKTLKTKAA
ncbi:MAG TPA: IS110 family transposase [Hyphomicrobiaceae bacterium]